MTIEEAYAEMKRRGWGYSMAYGIMAIGPITNPHYERDNEPPLIQILATDYDPIEAVQKAIAVAEGKTNGTQ